MAICPDTAAVVAVLATASYLSWAGKIHTRKAKVVE